MRAVVRAWLLFAATAVAGWAQPTALVGQWQAEETDGGTKLVSQLGLESDGRLTMTVDSKVDTAQMEGGAVLFPDGLALHVSGTGTWAVDGDSLRLVVDTVDIRFSGMTIEEVVSRLIDLMIQEMVVNSNIPADQVPAFEELVRAQLATQFNQDQLEAEMTTGLADSVRGNHALAYTVTSDVLVTVDNEGSTTEWHRGTGQSAVAPQSWGQVKGR